MQFNVGGERGKGAAPTELGDRILHAVLADLTHARCEQRIRRGPVDALRDADQCDIRWLSAGA